jgi:prepilin-type N-terminal cleavage/methylation domain-containing protein
MLKYRKKMSKEYKKGFTLIEILVGTAVFVIIALSVYQTYSSTIKVIRASRIKVTATSLIREQFEIIRNLPFTDIGLVNGTPSGKIPPVQNIIRNNNEFTITNSVTSIDDPFDGTDTSTPPDTTPVDYKQVEIKIDCDACDNFSAFTLSTYFSP